MKILSWVMNTSTAALILAGGDSARMNFPKPFLLLDGKPVICRIARAYADAGIQDIRIVMNGKFFVPEWEAQLRELETYASLLRNDHPEEGRFHSIRMGLLALKDCDYCFLHNADNPFVSPELFAGMMSSRNSWGYTVPVHMGRRGHPVLLSAKLVQFICRMPPGDQDFRRVLAGFPRRCYETVSEAVLLNLNTESDYERMLEWSRKSESYI